MTETERVTALDWSVHPPMLYPPYISTIQRSPKNPLVLLPKSLSEFTGPLFGEDKIKPLDSDLTRNSVINGEPLGERIIVTGRVLDDAGRPVENALIEIWQANAAGRYRHRNEIHDAPLDPNFIGLGRMLTDKQGYYRFVSIKPGAYPWGNHENAWRPPHIHFSVFGSMFISRLVTQMYFPGNPLMPLDPIYNSIPDEKGRERLIAKYDHNITQPEWALGFNFDIVLCGSKMTPFEDRD
jgi:protocatechuate 3,4-dioxygenase beta subunit